MHRQDVRDGCRKTFDQASRAALAVIKHPRFALGDVLKVGELGEDARKRGGRCCEEHVERLKFGMARRLSYPIGRLVADPLKAFLFDKRGLVIAASFSVGFDQANTGSGLLCLGAATA